MKRLAPWGVYGAGLMGAKALLGGEGVGLTRAVDMEKVLPCSAKGEAESMETTSHFRMLPMSSCSGVYSRPLPTCSMTVFTVSSPTTQKHCLTSFCVSAQGALPMHSCPAVTSIVSSQLQTLAHGQSAMAQHCTVGTANTDMLCKDYALPSCCSCENLQEPWQRWPCVAGGTPWCPVLKAFRRQLTQP